MRMKRRERLERENLSLFISREDASPDVDMGFPVLLDQGQSGTEMHAPLDADDAEAQLRTFH